MVEVVSAPTVYVMGCTCPHCNAQLSYTEKDVIKVRAMPFVIPYDYIICANCENDINVWGGITEGQAIVVICFIVAVVLASLGVPFFWEGWF